VRPDFSRGLGGGIFALVVLVADGICPSCCTLPDWRPRMITADLATAFAILGAAATRAVVTGVARAASHTSPATAAATRVLVILLGYLLVLLATLDLLSVPLQDLLVGSAVTGVVVASPLNSH